MPDIIRNYENLNQPIIDEGNKILSLTYFNLVRLARGQTYSQKLDYYETLFVVLSGNCTITVDGAEFADVGQRKDIWSGRADSVYAPIGAEVIINSNRDGTEIAVPGGYCTEKFAPFRISPDDVDMVDVGSEKTKSHRQIFHISGHNTKGKTGNLLVSELYADEGCWMGYPPHKHDEDMGEEETNFEEVYHYRFKPDNGFGALMVFQPDGTSGCFMTTHGDTCLIDKGYHPGVTSPGHKMYVFAILVGKTHNYLIQNFKEDMRYLMDKVPGIDDMRAKFK